MLAETWYSLPAMALRLHDGVLEPLVEHDAVRQAGERVVRSDEAQRIFRLCALQVLGDLAADRLQHGCQLAVRRAWHADKHHGAEGVAAKEERQADVPALFRLPLQAGRCQALDARRRRSPAGDKGGLATLRVA